MTGAFENPHCLLRNPVSASTHLFWALVACFVTALFWQLTRRDRRRRWSIMVFGVSMCLLFTASGVYHSLRVTPRLLNFFRLLDHSMIYVLIAGTFTPMVAILLEGRLRITLLVLIWAIAVVGIVCKWTLADPPYAITVGVYIGMGWIGIIPMPWLIQAIGVRGMAWSVLGGVLYTLGGIADAVRWPILIPGVVGCHEVLHVLDMFASLSHIYFVFRYILPYQGPAVSWVSATAQLPQPV